jgi:hypothetical protein
LFRYVTPVQRGFGHERMNLADVQLGSRDHRGDHDSPRQTVPWPEAITNAKKPTMIAAMVATTTNPAFSARITRCATPTRLRGRHKIAASTTIGPAAPNATYPKAQAREWVTIRPKSNPAKPIQPSTDRAMANGIARQVAQHACVTGDVDWKRLMQIPRRLRDSTWDSATEVRVRLPAAIGLAVLVVRFER